MVVRITRVSRPFYWYRHLIGEYIVVRPRTEYHIGDSKYPLGWDEQYWEVVEEGTRKRYVHFNDCVECTRYKKITKIKERI